MENSGPNRSYETFKDEEGIDHSIPVPGVEAEDDDAYLRWLESIDDDQIDDADQDDLKDIGE